MYDRNYEYFTAIAKERNISRAAEKLFISQPSLSKFLIQLERELGTMLFDRGRNVLELTAAGKLYLEYIQEAHTLRERFEKRMQELNTAQKVHLSLGITPGMASLISYTLLDQFQKSCPRVQLELVEDYGMQVLSMFRHGRIDMVLSMVDALPHNSKNIRPAPVMHDRILIVAPKSMPQVKVICPSDNDYHNPCPLSEPIFTGCHIITGKANHILYQKTKRIIEAYDLQPQSIIETFNSDNCLRMVDAGYGITFMSQMYIENGPALKQSAFFSIDHELFDCTRVVYYRADSFSSYRKELIDVIRQVCMQIPLS